MSKNKRMMFTILLTGLGQVIAVHSLAQELQPPTQPEQLIAKLAATEEKLKNLYVEGRVIKEGRASGETEWKPTGVRASMRAWYDGRPGGKARVDIDQVLEWREGVALFSYGSLSLSFDGDQGRVIQSRSVPMATPEDDTSKVRKGGEADLLTTAPEALRNSWTGSGTGAAFSQFYVLSRNGTRFSEYLKTIHSVPDQKYLQISIERFNDIECIKIAFDVEGTPQESFWLDPLRGLSLVRYTKFAKGEILEDRTIVTLKEVSPGIWYPFEAYADLPQLPPRGDQNKPGPSHFRLHYKAEKVVANDPAFDDAVFKAPIPAAYVVKDRTTGKAYKAK